MTYEIWALAQAKFIEIFLFTKKDYIMYLTDHVNFFDDHFLQEKVNEKLNMKMSTRTWLISLNICRIHIPTTKEVNTSSEAEKVPLSTVFYKVRESKPIPKNYEDGTFNYGCLHISFGL